MFVLSFKKDIFYKVSMNKYFGSLFFGILMMLFSFSINLQNATAQSNLNAMSPSSNNSELKTAEPVTSKSETTRRFIPVLKANLNLNAKGEEVKLVQSFLMQNGFMKSSANVGTFDKRTSAALKKFQNKYGLKAVGIINLATKNKLNSILKSMSNTTSSIESASLPFAGCPAGKDLIIVNEDGSLHIRGKYVRAGLFYEIKSWNTTFYLNAMSNWWAGSIASTGLNWTSNLGDTIDIVGPAGSLANSWPTINGATARDQSADCRAQTQAGGVDYGQQVSTTTEVN